MILKPGEIREAKMLWPYPWKAVISFFENASSRFRIITNLKVSESIIEIGCFFETCFLENNILNVFLE